MPRPKIPTEMPCGSSKRPMYPLSWPARILSTVNGSDERVAERTQGGSAMAQAALMDMGALAFANRAASELRATGAKRTPINNANSLTPQEREIAKLAASGLSNKEIGVRLSLSSRTVGTHLYRVFPKLGVHSRAGLRDALIRLSYLDRPDDP